MYRRQRQMSISDNIQTAQATGNDCCEKVTRNIVIY